MTTANTTTTTTTAAITAAVNTLTTAMPKVASDGMSTWVIVLIVLGSVSAAAAAVFTAYSVKYGFPWKKRNDSSINV